MQTMLGYLLHRNNNLSLVKAIILYDELINLMGKLTEVPGKAF